MTQRDRLIVLVLVATAVPLIGLFLLHNVATSFETREFQKLELLDQQKNHNLNIARAKLAVKRLREYQQQALSSDPLTARASLQSWLTATAEEFFIPETVLVRPLGNRTLRDESREREIIGEQISFRVSARGDLRQLTQFLHRFYSMNTLHRIITLNASPRDDSRLLDLVMFVDALSLASAVEGKDSEQALRESANDVAVMATAATATAPFGSLLSITVPVVSQSSQPTLLANKLWRDVISNDPPERFGYADHSYDDYAETILARNLFGDVNRAPQLGSIRARSGTTNERYMMTIKANDPDPYDRLSYELVGEVPADATLPMSTDGDAAMLLFTPPKAGEYQFTVAVADDGFPPKQVEQSFTVKVSDPRPVTPTPPTPEPPKFDFAKYTEVQAFLRGRDGAWEVWIHVKPRDEAPMELRVGDTFEIGSVKGRVQDIGPKSVILEINGEPRLFSRGEVLTAGTPPPEV